MTTMRAVALLLLIWMAAMTEAPAQVGAGAVSGASLTPKFLLFERTSSLGAVTSGNVTLLLLGGARFVRVDSSGELLDPTSLPLPHQFPAVISPTGSILPIDDGFAFIWSDNGTVFLRRLARRGDWIDPAPRELPELKGVLYFAAHANERDLLLSWRSGSGLFALRFDFNGVPLQGQPLRFDLPTHELSTYSFPVIAGARGQRLIVVQEVVPCRTLCYPSPFKLSMATVVLDREGHPRGPMRLTSDFSFSQLAIGLFDGTWVLKTGDAVPRLLHLSEDGSLLRASEQPLLGPRIVDVQVTARGWRTILQAAENDVPAFHIVDFAGADLPVAITAVTDVTAPRFIAGERLAFLIGTVSVKYPNVSTVETVDGDLSITAVEINSGSLRRVLVTVKNESRLVATNVVITARSFGLSLSNSPTAVVPSLLPGQAVYFYGSTYGYGSRSTISVASTDIRDIDPADNVTFIQAAETPARRVRPRR